MNIVSDGDEEGAEIEVSGTIQEFREIGQALLSLEGKTLIEGNQERDPFYSDVLHGIAFEINTKENTNKLLSIDIVGGVVCFVGPMGCFEKLGQSLLNFFSEGIFPGQHFHLSYYEGNKLIEPTKHELIFTYDLKID